MEVLIKNIKTKLWLPPKELIGSDWHEEHKVKEALGDSIPRATLTSAPTGIVSRSASPVFDVGGMFLTHSVFATSHVVASESKQHEEMEGAQELVQSQLDHLRFPRGDVNLLDVYEGQSVVVRPDYARRHILNDWIKQMQERRQLVGGRFTSGQLKGMELIVVDEPARRFIYD
jgi:hypothetical protein